MGTHPNFSIICIYKHSIIVVKYSWLLIDWENSSWCHRKKIRIVLYCISLTNYFLNSQILNWTTDIIVILNLFTDIEWSLCPNRFIYKYRPFAGFKSIQLTILNQINFKRFLIIYCSTNCSCYNFKCAYPRYSKILNNLYCVIRIFII